MNFFQLFIDPAKLLPLNRFLPKPAQPKGPKKKGAGGGAGRGGFAGRGGGGRGSFNGRGGGGNVFKMKKLNKKNFTKIFVEIGSMKLCAMIDSK